jgi:hypothetical protein
MQSVSIYKFGFLTNSYGMMNYISKLTLCWIYWCKSELEDLMTNCLYQVLTEFAVDSDQI